MTRKHNLPGIVCLVIGLSLSQAGRAQMTLDELETQLDFTIRSACHGYMIDAIPDFLSDARTWLNRETPFCQTVRTLSDSESAVELLRREQDKVSGTGVESQSASASLDESGEFVSRMREYYARQQGMDIECQDWMCQQVRMRIWHEGNPISQADYEKVAAYCDGGYGCIESWFSSWPRELPAQTVTLSLDALLEAQAETSPAAGNDATEAVDPGLGLDALLGTDPQPSAEVQALDDIATTDPDPGGAKLSLDSVFADRDQLALQQSQRRIDGFNRQLGALCECSLQNSGCFELPSQTLLDEANQQEQTRYDQCSEWQQQKSRTVTSTQQAEEQIGALAAMQRQIQSIDQTVATRIERFHDQQRRLLAQQKAEQERLDNAALMTGMLSILAQGGAMADGSVSAEQAAQNAFELTQSISNSGGGNAQITHQTVTSSVPGFAGDDISGSTSGNAGANSFSCYAPAHRICIDYSISSAQKAAQMKNQCRQGGNRLVDACDRQGPSCSMRSSVGSQTTFSYDSSASQVQSACIANGGSYRSY